MDPATAIGLAGNAYKLIIFVTDFVSDVKDTREKGGTDSARDINAVAKSVQSAIDTLDTQLAVARLEESNSKEDEELQDLAVRASEIGKELELKLQNALVQNKSKFRAIKAVLRGIWNDEEVKEIETRLRMIQDQIQFRIIVSIRKKVEVSEDERLQKMFRALEQVTSHQAQSHDDALAMLQALNRNEELHKEHHQELLRANEALLAEMKALSTSPRSPTPHAGLGADDDETMRKRAEDKILSSLWYSSMYDREDSISEAHQRTFDWIFQNPKEHQKPWDSFVEFLEGTASSYWISGKPGSGKSTAMKYVENDVRTQEHLKVWSSGRDLVSSHFYFFYNGPEHQKTELGLLVSLLHGILNTRREMIPIAFDEKFAAACHGYDISTTQISIPEARRSLRTLLRHYHDTCFFFMIDGLDEFDPSASSTSLPSLLDLTDSLGRFKNVKLVLASRPLTAFEQKFAPFPSLRMQELTWNDIRLYVEEGLKSHRRMQYLMKNDIDQSNGLIESIVRNSSGVFLWVRLVVASLLEGLTNYDKIDELQKRVDELPSDLHELYRNVLSRIDPQYRNQSAKLLRLALAGLSRHDNLELSALGMWFATQEDTELVFKMPVSPITEEDLENHVQEIDTRFKSRCRGLLEIQVTGLTPTVIQSMGERPKSDIYDPLDSFLSRRISFLHRSVSEFLQKDDVREEFLCIPNFLDPEAHDCLLRACIMVIKTYRLDASRSWTPLLKLASHAGDIAASLDRSQSPDMARYAKMLWELDFAMSKHLSNARGSACADKDSVLAKYQPTAHWSAGYEICKIDIPTLDNRFEGFPKDVSDSNFASFAAWCRLVKFIKYQTEEKDPSFIRKNGMSLLGHAMNFCWPWESYPNGKFELVEWLLSQSSDINESLGEKVHGRTIWEWFVRSLPNGHATRHWRSGIIEPALVWFLVYDTFRILNHLIRQGVEVNHRTIIRTGQSNAIIPEWYRGKLSKNFTGECTLLVVVDLMLQYAKRFTAPEGAEGKKELEALFDYMQQHEAFEEIWPEGATNSVDETPSNDSSGSSSIHRDFNGEENIPVPAEARPPSPPTVSLEETSEAQQQNEKLEAQADDRASKQNSTEIHETSVRILKSKKHQAFSLGRLRKHLFRRSEAPSTS